MKLFMEINRKIVERMLLWEKKGRMQMKKRWNVIAALGVLTLALAGCGGEEDVKVVNKVPASNQQETAENNQDAAGSNQDVAESEQKQETLTGYIFEVEKEEPVLITTDMKMADVLEGLGEPVSYFESASCAFNGLDKVYTYDHFRIETYPEGETDMISSVVFLDDLAETTEGVSIGMTKADMESAYGTDYIEDKGMAVYTKDGKHLAFLIKDDVIESIEYNSAVLDNVEQE